MDEATKKEINRFYGDMRMSEENLERGRKSFAEQLKRGLGEEITEFLAAPPSRKKENKSVWSRLANLF